MEVYEALMHEVHALGPVRVDPVQAGVSVKHGRKFAEIRPRPRHVEVWLTLPIPLGDPRVIRHITVSGGRVAHLLRLRSTAEVDDLLRGWLALAYDAAGG